MQNNNHERLDNLVCNNITINSGTLDSSVTVLGSPAPQEVASKGYVREFLGGSKQGTNEERPVITITPSSINVGKFRLYDSEGEVLMRYSGGQAEALGCCFLSLAGIAFLYVYAVSNDDGTAVKVVATTKLAHPEGFKHARRLGCFPLNQANNTLLEGVQYGREFEFNGARYLFSGHVATTSSKTEVLSFIPPLLPVKAKLKIDTSPMVWDFSHLWINGTSVCACCGNPDYFYLQTGSYSGIVKEGKVAVRASVGSIYYAIFVQGYEDVTL